MTVTYKFATIMPIAMRTVGSGDIAFSFRSQMIRKIPAGYAERQCEKVSGPERHALDHRVSEADAKRAIGGCR